MTVYKLIEIVGTSGTSIDDAIRGAIERASATVDHLAWFEVKEIRGRIQGKDAPEFQVKLDVGFRVEARSAAIKGAAKRARRRPPSRAAGSAAAQVAARRGEKRRTDLARSFKKQD